MNEEELDKYYNKFNEDKRLKTRHGKVEYITCMKYIHEYLKKGDKILDIGAGTGAYSIPIHEEGYDVTAVELVKHNIRVIEKKNPNIKTVLANATDLNMLKDKSYDVILLFGPMYHLITKDEKVKALLEAKRLLKDDGVILVNYFMNDYSVITHGFKDLNIIDAKNNKMIDDNFKCVAWDRDLYSVLRIEDIDELNKEVKLKRIKIITPDGPANYLRPYLNKMSEEEFNLFIQYHLSTCERMDMIGAAAHTLDILKKR